MKKIIIITLFFAFIFSLTACAKKPNETNTTIQQTTNATTTIETEITLPNYPDPKVIKLNPHGHPGEMDYEPTYRFVYGIIPYDLVEYVGSDEFEEWEKTMEYSPVKESHEMSIAKLAKDFNIPKEDFVEIYKEDVERYLKNGWGIYVEEDELPNPDIIYTFDNEVINAYYRRENPVAPDWSKTKTYESYAEYQKAMG